MALKASFIGAFLLSAIYVGFSYVAAFHSQSIAEVNQDQLIGTIAIKILGPMAGVATCVAVALACLTTAIALAAVFAEIPAPRYFVREIELRSFIGDHTS